MKELQYLAVHFRKLADQGKLWATKNFIPIVMSFDQPAGL